MTVTNAGQQLVCTTIRLCWGGYKQILNDFDSKSILFFGGESENRVFEGGKVQALTQLGLTSLQARVYLSFLTSGKTTARVAARDSGVARQEVYRVIGELLEIGLLRKVITKPTKFEPVPLNKLISHLLNEKRRNLAELEMGANELLKAACDEEKKTTVLQNEYEFTVMQENDKWFKSVNMWAGLKTHDLVLNSRRYSQVLLSSEDIDEALKGGVRMRVILDAPKYGGPLSRRLSMLEKNPRYTVKVLAYEPKAFFSVRDRQEVYLITKPWQPRGPPYLISNHPCLVEIAQNYFDTLWRRASKFSEFKSRERQEIYQFQ